MCNLYTQSKSPDEIARLFREQQIDLRFPEGVPNLQPTDIRITDPAPIVRSIDGGFDLVVRRWSWPGQGGKPVYNFRSDGREFPTGRCLILVTPDAQRTMNTCPGASHELTPDRG